MSKAREYRMIYYMHLAGIYKKLKISEEPDKDASAKCLIGLYFKICLAQAKQLKRIDADEYKSLMFLANGTYRAAICHGAHANERLRYLPKNATVNDIYKVLNYILGEFDYEAIGPFLDAEFQSFIGMIQANRIEIKYATAANYGYDDASDEYDDDYEYGHHISSYREPDYKSIYAGAVDSM